MFETERLMEQLHLFWQYPVVTEKTFYEQEKDNPDYAGVPWATIIDKKYNLRVVYQLLKPYFKKDNYHTCCQHIAFHVLIPLLKLLKIKTVYTPHKLKKVDNYQGIAFISCPLYAVNIEDDSRNEEFKDVDYMSVERPYLYSFIGTYNPRIYISDIRKRIFDMKHASNTLVESTVQWHFENIVYGSGQTTLGEEATTNTHIEGTHNYNDALLKSKYSLCPSGAGPNSIRIWESLATGAIPVILADTLDLPSHPLWNKAVIQMQEKELDTMPVKLASISRREEEERRLNCLIIYNHFKNNYANRSRETIHYCCNTYYSGATGGVPRYDYQLSLICPQRKFFAGPGHAQHLRQYLKQCKNPLVITDNHLACDIPNEYEVLLVHHGCAKTTAERNPDWGEPWRSLCTQGQDRMLKCRNPGNTTIISISQACTDDFTKYYGDAYVRFPRVDMLHPSELDDSRYKQTFSAVPIVLGNWGHIKKGSAVIPHLVKNLTSMKFKQLSIHLKDRDFVAFNRRKQDIYLESDIFLQLANSEGNAYATLDALMCGLVVVASNVGLFYNNVPEDCFVKLDWERNGDVEYVTEKLEYAWENRETISKKGREWYMENCRFRDWKLKMTSLLSDTKGYVQKKRIKQAGT